MLGTCCKIFTILFLVFNGVMGFAQTKTIEAIRVKLYDAKTDFEVRQTLLAMGNHHHSLGADSLNKYLQWGKKVSKYNSPEYLKFTSLYCIYLFKSGKPKESLLYADSILSILPEEQNYQQLNLDLIAIRSTALIRNNQFKEAIHEILKLLHLAEKSKDYATILKGYTLMGWANMELEKYNEAITWLRKGISFTQDSSLLFASAAIYNNLGACYNSQNNIDSALHFVNMGIRFSRITENLFYESNGLNIRAGIFMSDGKDKAAENDLEVALKLREQIGDLFYTISDMAQLSSFYASINQSEKGIAIAQKGIAIAEKGNYLSKLIFLKIVLAENYKKANKLNEYANTLYEVIGLKDSLYKTNSEDAIAEIEVKYQLQKKEYIINQQENIIIKNKYFYFGTAVALIIIFIFIWLKYREYHFAKVKKMEDALTEEKEYTLQAVNHAKEKERKRIAADLHDNLGSYAAAIAANVSNLKESRTDDNEPVISQLEENAKAIVTQLSDSIWVLKNEQLHATTLADRFKAWAQRMMQNYPHINYYYDENITNNIEFTPYKALNIFLILKECLNNALKHSGCTAINIRFASNEHLHISLKDNGIGFQHEPQKGNGMENMKRRAEESNLHIEWLPILPSGVEVIIYDTH